MAADGGAAVGATAAVAAGDGADGATQQRPGRGGGGGGGDGGGRGRGRARGRSNSRKGRGGGRGNRGPGGRGGAPEGPAPDVASNAHRGAAPGTGGDTSASTSSTVLSAGAVAFLPRSVSMGNGSPKAIGAQQEQEQQLQQRRGSAKTREGRARRGRHQQGVPTGSGDGGSDGSAPSAAGAGGSTQSAGASTSRGGKGKGRARTRGKEKANAAGGACGKDKAKRRARSGTAVRWRELPDDVIDPITLEPINASEVAPFELATGETHSYYDGATLAGYLLNRRCVCAMRGLFCCCALSHNGQALVEALSIHASPKAFSCAARRCHRRADCRWARADSAPPPTHSPATPPRTHTLFRTMHIPPPLLALHPAAPRIVSSATRQLACRSQRRIARRLTAI